MKSHMVLEEHGDDLPKADPSEEMLRWVAQTVHQAYHESGTWHDCPKDICSSIKGFLEERESR